MLLVRPCSVEALTSIIWARHECLLHFSIEPGLQYVGHSSFIQSQGCRADAGLAATKQPLW